MEGHNQKLTAVDPLRWTYAGALDDVVARFPWPHINVNKHSLDFRLAYSVVTGTPMLLNDGYLVLNSACLESLGDEYSPLRVLMNKNYVRVLSRNPSRSLKLVAEDGAKQGIESYQELLQDKKQWKIVQKALEQVQTDLVEHRSFVGWPRVDLTPSYLQLIRLLAKLPHEKRGLGNIPDSVFRSVVDRFENELSKEANRPRSRWEEIVMHDARRDAMSNSQARSLMQLANEVYHHNFGVALAASPPAELPKDCEIAVQSRISEPFLQLYKTHTPKLSTPNSIPLPVGLPKKVDYSNGNLLIPFFDKEQAIGRTRASYLNLRARYLAGLVQSDEMCDLTCEYQDQLNRYWKSFSPRGKIATHVANVAVGSVPVLLAVTHLVVAPIPTTVIGIVSILAAEYGNPTLMEKWKLPQALDWLKRSTRLRSPEWGDAVSARTALTAISIDRNQASNLVGQLPVFN